MKTRGFLHHTPPEEPFGERFSPYLQSVNTRHNQRHLVVHIRQDNIQGFFCNDSSVLDCLTVRPECQTGHAYSITGRIAFMCLFFNSDISSVNAELPNAKKNCFFFILLSADVVQQRSVIAGRYRCALCRLYRITRNR